MYLCVLSSTPDDPNDKPYDPSAHMNGFQWKHHQVNPKNVEKQIRDLMNEGVDVFFNLCDGTPDDALSGIGLVQVMENWVRHLLAQTRNFSIHHSEMKSYAKNQRPHTELGNGGSGLKMWNALHGACASRCS